jgi:cytochrome c553
MFGTAACTLLLGATRDGDIPQPTRESWRVPEANLKNGEKIAEACVACHGSTDLRLDPPAPKLHRQRTSYVFFALLEYRDGIRDSTAMTPAVAGMSEQDIRDVAAFVSGELLDRPPRARTDLPAYGKAARDCAWCHGETGIGELEGMPVLTGQDRQYLKSALAEYRDGIRKDPTMSKVAKEIDPEDFDALAEYYSSHEWLEKAP